jgi:hypothetical protein
MWPYRDIQLVDPTMTPQYPTTDRQTDNSASILETCSVTLHCKEPETQVVTSSFENLGRAARWKCNQNNAGPSGRGATAYYEGGNVPSTVNEVISNSDSNADPKGMLPDSRSRSMRAPADKANITCIITNTCYLFRLSLVHHYEWI